MFFYIIGCSGEQMSGQPALQTSSLAAISAKSWDELSQKAIFFGHQSVGENILEGIGELQMEHPEIKLQIVKAQNVPPQSSSFFAHAYVGRNG